MTDQNARPDPPLIGTRFQTYIEHVSDIVSVIDMTGKVLYVSPSIESVLGYAQDEHIGENVFEFIHPDDLDGTFERFLEAIDQEGETVESAEFRFKAADGSYLWLEAIGRTQIATDIEGFVITSRDITERKQRLRELRRYETILSHSSDMTIIVDGNLKVEYISPAVEPMLGYSQGEVIGTNSFDYIHPDDLEEAVDALSRTVTHPDEVITVEYRSSHADGGWVWVEVRGRNYLDDPYIDGIMVDVRDISQRKEHERALKNERDRANALFSRLGEPVVEVVFEEASPYIKRMNDTFKDTFGLDESAVGEALDAHIVPEESIESAMLINEDVGSGNVSEREVERMTDDGRRTFLLRTVPFRVDDEARAHAIYIDITDRKKRERELERQNERLERVSRVISHDLRNPLTVAKGYLEIAREAEDPDEALEMVGEAHERMDDLIEDTLALARQGQRIVEFEPVRLSTLAGRCWSMVNTGDATIDCVDDVAFEGDPDALAHVFENLFRNAIQHGDDEVTVTVGSIGSHGIFIEDDGPGIDPDKREEVFEPGYSTSGSGTGFGLAIVKEIIDAHGWDIAVTAGEAGGARFEITGMRLADT